MSRKKILIFYDYFLPGFKAGGPVQSLANLIMALQQDYEFIVMTSAYDLGAAKPYPTIQTNQWNDLAIGNTIIKIWYADKVIDYAAFSKTIRSVLADFVFFNCIYSYRFFLYPLLHKNKLFSRNTKFINSPRGILQPGSFAVKGGKKKLYLYLLKKSGLLRNCFWHATGIEESMAIKKKIGNKASIKIISNIPKVPLKVLQIAKKQESILRLVHLSLITPVKNIKILILVLSNCKETISLDIYGPIKDESYWQGCKDAMLLLPPNVSVVFKGDLQPTEVQKTLQQYDSLILLTAGENFGHALFESLSVGRPIITSYFTPWNNLESQNAGWNVDIQRPETITTLLDLLAKIDNQIWQRYCGGAHQLAVNFFHQQDFVKSYQYLFS